MSFDIPEGAKLVGPTDEAISEARRLADNLIEIATAEAAVMCGTGTAPSQSDRLVIIAAKLGQISGLLRHRFVVPDEA